jgi:glycosyltransferase involved in cell wall biosynthesis
MTKTNELIHYDKDGNFYINKVKTQIIDETGTDKPLVTVIMLTYNHENFIEDAINGVINQLTNFKFVLLIGEDCSTDKTREKVINYQKQYPELIKLNLPDKNLGVNFNLLSCMLMAEGSYVAFNDGDDYWIDNLKLQKQVDFLEKHPEYVISSHRCVVKNVDYETLDTLNPSQKTHFSFQEIVYKTHWHSPSIVYRNMPIIKNLPEFFLEIMICDSTLNPFFTKVGGYAHYSTDIMAVYRLHENSTWSSDQGNKSKIPYAITKLRLYQYFNINDEKLRIEPFYRIADVIAREGYKRISWWSYQKELWNYFKWKRFYNFKYLYLFHPLSIFTIQKIWLKAHKSS